MSKESKLVFSKLKKQKFLKIGTLATILATVATAFIPLIYGKLVDIALLPKSSLKLIGQLILLWIILSLVNTFLHLLGQRISSRAAANIVEEFTVEIFERILQFPMRFHKEKRIGEVMRKLDRGVWDLHKLIDSTIFNFAPSLLSFLIALVILLVVKWQLSLILIVFTIVYVIITITYTKKIVKTQKLMQRGWEKSYGGMWDAMMNAHTVKINTAEGLETQKNAKKFNSAINTFFRMVVLWQNLGIWQKLIFSFSFIIVFAVGILMLRLGQISPGELIMFVGYISLVTAPLSELANQYKTTKNAIASFKRVTKYYDSPIEKDHANARNLADVQGAITFQNVTFGYKANQPVLKNISFKIKPGQTVAFVGESGGGKTTLIDLVGRYFKPDKGKIFIDNIALEKIKIKSLRDQLALVPQDVLLFNDTIKNNILYGRSKSNDKALLASSKVANAHEFIQKFPKKYEQLVGNRGIKLSAGQKQRVAIARAILRDPKILILDEATSALDSVSEKLVQQALARLIQNRTTLVIAHRLSTIQKADKIIVLDKGRIIEQGTHKQLIQKPDGAYRKFWYLQTELQKA